MDMNINGDATVGSKEVFSLFYANAVGIGVFQRPGSNAIAISDGVRARMAELKKGLSGFQEEFRSVTREAERSMAIDMHDTAPAERSRPVARPAAPETAADDFAAPKFDLE